MKERTFRALQDLVEKANKLNRYSHDRHIAKTGSGFRGQQSEDGGWNFEFDIPDEKELDASLLTLGLFTQQKEAFFFLDRPAVTPEIAWMSAGLLADFGASDAAILDIVFGKLKPGGKLSFELPASVEAGKKQKEDLLYDSENPIFPFGFGFTY